MKKVIAFTFILALLLVVPVLAHKVGGDGSLFAEGYGEIKAVGLGVMTFIGAGEVMISGTDDIDEFGFECVKQDDHWVCKGDGFITITALNEPGKLSVDGEGELILQGTGKVYMTGNGTWKAYS